MVLLHRNSNESNSNPRSLHGSYSDDVPELSDDYYGAESRRFNKQQPSYDQKDSLQWYSRKRIPPQKSSFTLPSSHSPSFADSCLPTNTARSKVTSKKLFTVIKIMIAIALTFGCSSSGSRLRSRRKETLEFKNEMGNMHNAIEETQNLLDRLHVDFVNLHTDTIEEEEASIVSYYGIEHQGHREAASNDIIHKYDGQHDDIEVLQKHIQNFHRKELHERFGPGPYYIEFEVSIEGKTNFFTLKTAPIDLMPHSIYVFMDMVHRKVWNNTVIIHMWNHIVQAAPITPEGENRRTAINGELMFPEHSDFFNHEEYTVGFSGRPGGPEFYINLLNNASSHGPGRQDHSKVLNDADPCFAKVIDGHHTVDLLRALSVRMIKDKKENGGQGFAFSSIEEARIIIPQTSLAGEID